MARTGRPLKDIDWEVADKAAALMCTGEEIAALCKVNYERNILCTDSYYSNSCRSLLNSNKEKKT